MVVSLTVTPMMCAWLLKEDRGHGYLYNQSEKILPLDHLHLWRRRSMSCWIIPRPSC